MASSFETTLFPIVQTINEYLSNYVLVILLLGVGIWYTIKTRCVQVRCFKEGWNRVFGNITLNGKKGGGGMSSFQALATAIAAQVGTGIIVGVAGAILTGGPGAVFWMWVISFFGMATIYAEATLAQETRIVELDGTIKGGPVYYITTAFKGKFGKFLAGFFAVAITLALGFMGCMVQSNSIGATMETAFGIPSWVVGIVLIVICAFIFLGGVQRLASVTEKVVPLMAAVFLFGGLIAASGFLTPQGAADFGWFAYTPLSDAVRSPGAGGDLWIMGLWMAGLGTILGAVNFITTIICMRAPGMTMFRMPIFVWNTLITSLLVLIAFPVLAGALLSLEADRQLGAHVFDTAHGGAILWQHLFWFFGHPEVYIIALPFFGIAMM